jgi:tol-pal system protein YbgF
LTYGWRAALGALAVAAGLSGFAVFSAAPVSAQVMNATPYVPQPDPAVERLSKRLDALEADLRSATNRIDQLGFELSSAKKAAAGANAGRVEAERTIATLTGRIEALERLATPQTSATLSAPAEATVNLKQAPASGPAPSMDPGNLPQGESELLAIAKGLLVDGQIADARQAAEIFVQRFPKSASAGDAQYTVGEAMMIQKDYQGAAGAYGKLITSYPKSEQAAMGLVKLARALRLLDKKQDACKTLGLLQQKYPVQAKTDVIKSLVATEKSRAGC